MERMRNMFNNYFSNGSKLVFVTVLILIGISTGLEEAKKTIVVAVDGKETKIVTYRSSFKSALEDNNIVLEPEDEVVPSLDSKIKKNDRIDIKRALEVFVAVDGEELNIKTTENTVEEMLADEGIEIGEQDKISTSLFAPISDGLKVGITRVETKTVEVAQPIDFATEVRNDRSSKKGNVKVIQEGQQGEKIITTKIVFEDGQEVSREVASEVVSKEPVKKIVAVGTLTAMNLSRGESIGKITALGNTEYTAAFKVKSTAYTADFQSTGKNPGDPGYGRTATGTKARRDADGFSSIAVDPRVIPYGTKLYIEGYGYAIAEDTGGAIKGNKVDVFFNTNAECMNWGVRYVNVYILK
jgi:uncharacterized protein YabE (DUF348 family)